MFAPRARCRFLFVALAAMLLTADTCCAMSVHLDAPQWVTVGGQALLRCRYSTQYTDLHKVEWFRDIKKIFSFIKGRKPPFTNHTVPGAEIDMMHSNEREVLLKNMDVNASGDFFCEVSTESPSIYTKSSEDIRITVYDAQRSPPRLTGVEEVYSPGQTLAANCTSIDGHPPPAITWLIDEVPVDDQMVVNWVLPVGATVSGSSFALVLDALESEKELKEFKLTCVTSHPPYTGPLDYVDIKRTDVTVSVMNPTDHMDNMLESISSSSAAASSAGRPRVALVLLLLVGALLALAKAARHYPRGPRGLQLEPLESRPR